MAKGQTNNPNGRPKGALSKKTVEARAIANRLKCDPFEILLLFAKGDWKKLGYPAATQTKSYGEKLIEEPTISPDLRAASAGKAIEYIYPKRKSVEQTLDPETISHITRTVLTKPVERKPPVS